MPRAGSMGPGGTVTSLSFLGREGQACVTQSPRPGSWVHPQTLRLPPRPLVPSVRSSDKPDLPTGPPLGTALCPAQHPLTWGPAPGPGREPSHAGREVRASEAAAHWGRSRSRVLHPLLLLHVTHSRTHSSLTHSFTHPFIHSPTHSLIIPQPHTPGMTGALSPPGPRATGRGPLRDRKPGDRGAWGRP